MIENLVSYFETKKIPFDIIKEVSVRTIFETTTEEGKKQKFLLFVFPFEDMFGDEYCRFAIIPFAQRPDEVNLCEWHVVISLINHNLPSLKFAVDSEGDLELVLDVPSSEMDIDRFTTSMQVIADYAGLYYPLFEELALKGISKVDNIQE